ncbi:ESX secretion-associated protein EspG [Nocardia cyriacigeorgica]|uniref:ESX secretion-associated protein EspG n=1 Tax=Nocardia cyriacigeorgica TaxID=135487 RepID=UPI00189457C1|nr:ESX secretion-associated protein EspG [Nocardia cyriacigeorgica]MBF6096661.1 ESX secretion-associated protein EspG [Nocardia cyriacigeorgica]MBF6162472.1 ESX secretion-associated protein EspG [Nocardia cyriacigeorgica]MBF6201544.1 ESX secretion-associated protein EspG [Nocardia cyriacigeorgica]MBF6317039.1 ESX secretion-associated protein EspG [Nocardia cyriacigeorgica]MBF6396459.1 ESX secretion-associated protein EspG [Nocardia cyriacigeorgica]
MRWTFTPDEFMHVWSETGLDRYPFPLSLISSVRWEDEYERLAAELSARLPHGDDPDLSAALRVAAHPDTVVTLTGTRRHPIRVYSAIVATVAVTLVQLPGTDPEFGGSVVVETGGIDLPPKVISSILGDCPAGRHRPLVEDCDRLRADDQGWNGSAPTTADRMRKLLSAPREASGRIEIRHRVRSERPDPRIHLGWFDVVGDGRYVYRQRYLDFHIHPIEFPDLRDELRRLAIPPEE